MLVLGTGLPQTDLNQSSISFLAFSTESEPWPERVSKSVASLNAVLSTYRRSI